MSPLYFLRQLWDLPDPGQASQVLYPLAEVLDTGWSRDGRYRPVRSEEARVSASGHFATAPPRMITSATFSRRSTPRNSSAASSRRTGSAGSRELSLFSS